MKALVTGSSGFLGRHFVKKLKENNWEVIEVDISMGISCEDFFKSCNDIFDYVFHLACFVEPQKELKNIKTTNFSYDLILDSLVFSWLIKTKQKNFIYFSSSAVYPISLQDKIGYKLKESDVDINSDIIRKPDNIYGWTKLTGEYMIEYLKRNGINVFVFRPFSIFGNDQNSTFIYKNFLNLIEKKEDIFHIWGDGKQVRDFIHVDDVVNCVLTALERKVMTPMNIGRGIPVSINELLEIMFEASGYRPKQIAHLLDKDGGSRFRCADIALMSKVYVPRITIEETVSLNIKEMNK